MNWFFTTRFLTAWLTILSSLVITGLVQAQTITVGTNVSPATNLCSNSTISLAFSTTGVFTAGNIFTLQQSDENGLFTSPVVVANLASAPVTASTLTISGSLGTVTYGTSYRFRVVASSPVRTSNQTPGAVTIGTVPPTPGQAGQYVFCPNSGLQPITASGTGTIEWYNGAAAGAAVVFTGNPYNVPTNSTPVTYYATQTVNGCKSAKVPVTITLSAPVGGPGFTPPAAFCPGQGPATLTATPTSTGVAATIQWQLASGTQTGASIPTPQTTGTYTYTLSQFNSNGCVGTGTTVATVTVNAAPGSAPTPNVPVAYCADAIPGPLTATLTGGGTSLKWYNLTDNTSATTATIPAPNSTKQYQVSQFIGSCEGPRSIAFTVTVNQKPGDPSLVTASTGPFCQNSGTQTITATGQNIEWFTSLSAPTATVAGPNFPVSTAGGNLTIFFRQVVNGCGSNRVSSTIIVNPTPASAPSFTPPATYCSNDTPGTLTATLTGGATSARWYQVGSSSIDGASIPAPATTTQYQISQFIGSCEGPRSVVFTVNVTAKPGNPSPGSAVGPFCQNSGANNVQTISAVGTGTIEWFLSPTTTTVSATGNNFTVSTASASPQTVYYRQVVNGCPSDRLALTVIINALPIAPGVSNVSVCQNAAQQTLTASSTGNLTWYVQGNNAALPGAPRPSTSQPNSQTIYEVTQTDGNGCTSAKSTGLTFFVRTLPGRPTVSGTYAYCEAQSPVSLTASGATLRWYANGGTTLGTFLANNALAAPQTVGAYTFQVTQTDGNNCQSDFLAVPVQVKDTPDSPTVSYANAIASYCQGRATRPLEAAGSGLLWYASPGGTGTTQAPSPATTNLGDTPFYVTQTSAEGCQSAQRTVTARVFAIPARPVFIQPKEYCAEETPVTLSATGSGVLWYAAATGGTGSGLAPTPSTAASNVGTPQLFYVTQNQNGCESERQPISVTVKRKPTVPITTSNVDFCQTYGVPTLTATPENGASLVWIVDGRESSTAPSAPNNVARTYTYQVLQTLNGCRSNQAPVTVRVKATPGQPGITPYSLCVGRESRPLQVTGTDVRYYDANNQLIGTTAPSPGTGQVATVGYQVSQSIDGCEGPKIVYNVPVFAIPANPTFTQPKEYCAEEPAVPLVASGQTLLWYTASNGGTNSGQSPTPGTLAANVGSGQTFYVTQTVNGCESNRQPISVTVKRKPAAPITTSNVEFCQTYSAPNLTATPENGASLIWITDGRESTAAPSAPNNVVQSYVYQVLQDLNGCRSNRASITVRVKLTPGQPGITPFQLCQFGPGRALLGIGTDLKYYDINNSPLGSVSPVVNTAIAQTVIYQVSQSRDGCEGGKINYPIIVQPKPSPPATQAITYCLESSTNPDQPKQTVQPLMAQGQNLQWFFVDGNAFPEGFVPTPGVNNVYSMDFRVTQTVNNCASDQALLRVTVQAQPAPVVSTSLVTLCRNEAARPLEATGTNLRWIDPAGVLSTQAPTPQTLNATKGGEAYYVYSISPIGCVSPRSTIRLVVNTNPTLGLLGSTTVNYGQSASLRLVFTSLPPYSYTLTDGTAGTANDTLSSVTVKPLQTTTYRVASVSNVCGNGLPGNPATATIFVNIPTILTEALATQAACAGTSFAVNYTTTGVFNTGNAFRVQIADTTSKNYVDVLQTVTGNRLTATLPAGLRGGSYFVRVLGSNPGAEVAGQRSPTVLMVRGLPAAVLSGTREIYETQSINLNVSLTGDGPWTVSYASITDGVRSATTTFLTNANPHVLTVQPLKTTVYFSTAVSNNCGTGPVSGTATVTVLPLLAVENPLLSTVSLFPVPTQTLLTIAIDLPLSPQNPARLTLRNLTGTPVLIRQTDTRQTVLDLGKQPAGLYLLNVEFDGHQVVRKVMKL